MNIKRLHCSLELESNLTYGNTIAQNQKKASVVSRICVGMLLIMI